MDGRGKRREMRNKRGGIGLGKEGREGYSSLSQNQNPAYGPVFELK
jgi:hypothetical protein